MADASDPWGAFPEVPKSQDPKDVWSQFPVVQKEDAPGLLESFGRGLSSGATFGFDKSLGMSKERDEAAAKANPWTHFAGEVAGSIAPTVAATVAAPEVAIPGAIAKAAPWLERGYAAVRSAFVPSEIASTGQALGQAAKLSTSYGALAGAGHADVNPDDTLAQSLEKRGVGAIEGGLTGLVTSPVFGLAGHGIYRGAQGIGSMLARASDEIAPGGKGALNTMVKGFERDRTSPQELIDQIQTELPSATTPQTASTRFWGPLKNKQAWTQEQVEEVARRALNGETASQIEQAMRPGAGSSISINPGIQSGPGTAAIQTLMDELASRNVGPVNIIDRAAMVRPGAGENTQWTMRAAANTPGDARSIARENLLERQIGAGGRLNDLFDRFVGSSDYDAVAQNHANKLASAADTAFTLAKQNEQPFDVSPILNRWFTKEVGNGMRGPVPEGMQNAIESVMSNEPIVNPITGMQIGTQRRPPQTLDEFMKARANIRQQIQTTQPGSELYNKLTGLYKDLTNEVARTNPDWSKANQLYADGKAAEEAMQAGANMGLRVNSGSRENFKYFTDAQSDAASAQKDLNKANAALKKLNPASANPGQLSQAQSAVQLAQSRLDAANARQDLFRVGLVRSLRDQTTENNGATNNLTRLLQLPGAKKMLGQVLGPDADQFNKAIAAEAAMHRTYSSQFGAQTTPLREAIDELNWAPQIEGNMVTAWLNPLNAITNTANLAAKYAAQTVNARRNAELMNMYTETNPLNQLDLLRQAQALHQTRSNWGNALGRPAISAVVPFNAAVEDPTPKPWNVPLQPYQP